MVSLEKVYTACNEGKPYDVSYFYYKSSKNFILNSEDGKLYEPGANSVYRNGTDHASYHCYCANTGLVYARNGEFRDDIPMAIVPRREVEEIILQKDYHDSVPARIRDNVWSREAKWYMGNTDQAGKFSF